MAEMKREAMYYNKIRKGLLQCQLCPHYCIIHAGEKGFAVAGKTSMVSFGR
jgi:uncharacterized Fe-S radical SAM superfamily protein PflX